MLKERFYFRPAELVFVKFARHVGGVLVRLGGLLVHVGVSLQRKFCGVEVIVRLGHALTLLGKPHILLLWLEINALADWVGVRRLVIALRLNVI